MTSDYVSGQAVAAMRALGLKPAYFESVEDVSSAFDHIKRVAIEDWESDRKMSKAINEERMMKVKILAALANSVLMGFMPDDTLENREVRMEDLRPGMFVRERDATSVIVHVEKLESQNGSFFRMTTIRSDANEVGTMTSSTSGLQGGRIYHASKGVSDIVNPNRDSESDGR